MSNKLSRSISSKQKSCPKHPHIYPALYVFGIHFHTSVCVVCFCCDLLRSVNIFSEVCWPSLISFIICLKMRCNGQITYISLINRTTLLSSDLPFSFLVTIEHTHKDWETNCDPHSSCSSVYDKTVSLLKDSRAWTETEFMKNGYSY